MFFCILTLENGEQKDITPMISFFLDVVSIFVSFGNILLDFINTVVDIPWTSHLFFLEYEIRIYIYRNKVNVNHATFSLIFGFSSLQISIGERTMEGSPFSERPVSSHSAYCQQRLEENRQQHKNSIFHPPSSIPEEEKTSNKFQSSFARSLNLPPCAMDERTWLANELLETRQVHKFSNFSCIFLNPNNFFQLF